MIQRIQSVYLLISAICLGLMMKFPFASFADSASFDAFGLHNAGDHSIDQLFSFPPHWMVLGLMALTVLIIFLFKKRKVQATLCRISYLLILAMIVLLYLNIDAISASLSSSIEYGVGLYLPVAALAFNFLANRSIKKDENLVKSLDRLR